MISPEVKLPRAQRLINYMTEVLCLKLPIKDDSLVPSASTMAPGVGMSVRNTAEAMVILRKRKLNLLPDPTPENTRRRSRVSGSLSRGGKGLVLERYAFMTGEEAYLALSGKLGEEKAEEMGLDEKSVGRILSKQRTRDGIKRTDEEKKFGHKLVHEPKEVKRGRALFWTRVVDLLEQQGVNSPTNRMVWIDIWQRAEDVMDGARLVVDRLAQGRRLYFVVQQILEGETQVLKSSLSAHIRNNFVADEKNEKVFKGFRETIDRVDSMPLTLAEKERLLRCLFWEEKGATSYGRFFGVPKESIWQSLKDLIDGDMDDLHFQYDNLLPPEPKEKTN